MPDGDTLLTPGGGNWKLNPRDGELDRARVAAAVAHGFSIIRWYLDREGRNTTLWPTFTFTFHQQMWRCDLSEYAVLPRVDRSLAVPA